MALQPSLVFIAVSVNPDTMLFAVSTFALLTAARVVRHGVTLRRALALGTLVGVGLVTKLTFLGLVPGLALALLIGLVAYAGGARVRLVWGPRPSPAAASCPPRMSCGPRRRRAG